MINFELSVLNVEILAEKNISQRYWLKQARAHFRASITHEKSAQAILRKIRTYAPGETLKAGV